MTYDQTADHNPLATSIEATIAQHGAFRVFGASLVALLHATRFRRPLTDADDLGDHLRRDVGLPPHRASGPAPPVHFLVP